MYFKHYKFTLGGEKCTAVDIITPYSWGVRIFWKGNKIANQVAVIIQKQRELIIMSSQGNWLFKSALLAFEQIMPLPFSHQGPLNPPVYCESSDICWVWLLPLSICTSRI